MMEWVKRELDLAGLFDKDSDYGGMLGEAVMELFGLFEKQGHSGYSSMIVARIFENLVAGVPLTPLRGTSDEWESVGTEEYQNRRMGSVFAKNSDGEGAYFLDGYVFVDKNGARFTCRESVTPVTFPSIPKSVYIYEGTPEAEEFLHVFL